MIHKHMDSENLLVSIGGVSYCSPIGKLAKVAKIEKMTYSRISEFERDEMTSAQVLQHL